MKQISIKSKGGGFLFWGSAVSHDICNTCKINLLTVFTDIFALHFIYMFLFYCKLHTNTHTHARMHAQRHVCLNGTK